MSATDEQTRTAAGAEGTSTIRASDSLTPWMMFLTVLAGLAVALSVAALALYASDGGGGGGGGGGGESAGPSTSPTADAVSGFRFQPDAWTVPAGQEFTFTLTNTDAVAHNWKVLSKEIAEESEFEESLVLVGTGAENVAAGATGTATGTLEAGTYQVICSVPGHFAAGMKGTLTAS